MRTHVVVSFSIILVVLFSGCTPLIDPEAVNHAPVALAQGEQPDQLPSHGIAPYGVPVSDYLDIPESALGPAIDPEKGYYVEEIRDGLYWLTEGIYQIMFMTTGEGVIVVDAPPTIGERVLAGIGEVTDEPVTHVIYSHSHIDHIGAASMYPEDVEIIAHADTALQLERANDPNRPLPTIVFEDTYTLEVGNQMLELAYPGNNHDPGNRFIYAPEQKVMTFIELVFPGWMPWRRLAVAEDIPGYFNAGEELLTYDFDVLIAGHVGRLGTREDVELQQAFMADLRSAALSGLQSVQVSDVVQALNSEDATNPWAIFDGYIDGVVEHCVAELVPIWADQLAGFDVFIYDQCLAMEQSLRID